MQAGTGTLIAFAAGPGQEADENPRARNGLYTSELLKHMGTPGISILDVFQRTREGVYRRSRRKQTPQDWNQLVGNIYLAGAARPARPAAVARTQSRPAPPARQSIDADEQTWRMIQDSKSIEEYQDYLEAFPKGRFAAMARIKMRRLKRVGITKKAPALSTAQRQPKGMVKIPGGRFLMGDEKNGPVHRVRLSPFFMDQTEVTQEAYKKVTRTTPSEFYYPDKPVNRVSWYEAKRYCEKLGKRLPTEAEWEYAARAGTRSVSILLSQYSNFCGDQCAYSYHMSESDGFDGIAPVKSFKPNPWKLFDMSGNLSEWVADWHGPYDFDDTDDPAGPTVGTLKVHRGGSFEDPPTKVTSAFRHKAKPGDKLKTIGFRCAADVRK